MKNLIDKLTAHIPFRRRLFSGASWAFGVRMATITLGLIIAGLLARILSPEHMGAYFVIFSLVQVAVIGAQLGLNQAVVRLVAESLALNDKGRARSTIVSVLLYGTVGGVVVGGVYYFWLGTYLARDVFASDVIEGVIGVTALWVIILTLQRLFAEAFRGLHDIRLASTFGGFVTSLISAVIFWFMLSAQYEATLNDVLYYTIIASLISAALASVILFLKMKPLTGEGKIEQRIIWSGAWSLLLGNIVNVLLMRSDIWLVGSLLGSEDAALYGAAARIITLVVLPAMIVSAVVPPMIAELYTQGRKDELEKVMRGSATLSAIPALAILLIFIFGGGPLLGMIYGPYYTDAALVLAILSLGQLASAWAGPCAQLLLMSGHDKALLVINVFAVAFAVAASLLFIDIWGMHGIAAAYALAVTLQNAAMVTYGYKKIGVKTYIGFHVPVRSLLKRRRGGRRGGARPVED